MIKRHCLFTYAFILSALFPVLGWENSIEPLTLTEILSKGVEIDLKNPCFKDNTFSTDEGGVIYNEHIRIQARHITYERDLNSVPQRVKVEADGDLLIHYYDQVFVAKRMEYDFTTKTGTLYEARTKMEAWYIGGNIVTLNPDGSFFIDRGFITSCESSPADWQVEANSILIHQNRSLSAMNFKILFWKIPVFWLPHVKSQLDDLFDSPIRYQIYWGGGKGFGGSARYRFYNGQHLKLFAKADYRINRGAGIALESEFNKGKQTFSTTNYLAHDTSILDPTKRKRYRLEGVYSGWSLQDKVSVDMQYDRLSDSAVVSDFYNKDFNLQAPLKTELALRHQNSHSIVQMNTTLRINPFQSTLTKIPELSLNLHPYQLGNSGIIGHSFGSLSYLDFQFPNDYQAIRNYSAVNSRIHQEFYRPFPFQFFRVTPSMKGTILAYSDGNTNHSVWQPAGTFSVYTNTLISNTQDSFKHTVEPYIHYKYVLTSNQRFLEHKIFDSRDTAIETNTVRLGVRNMLYQKEKGFTQRKLALNIFADAFLNDFSYQRQPPAPGSEEIILNKVSRTQRIPRAQGVLDWSPLSSVLLSFGTGWNFEGKTLDHYNSGAQWTVNENIALRCDYSHRSPYDWRKGDKDFQGYDAFYTKETLLNSTLSDQRDNIVTHAFFKLSPVSSFELRTRNGWNRTNDPAYREWKAQISRTFYTNWKFDVYYLFTEGEKRMGINFAFVDNNPKKKKGKKF